MSLIDSILVPQKLLEAGFTETASNYIICTINRKSICNSKYSINTINGTMYILIPIIAENYILRNKKEVDKKIELSMKLSAVICISMYAWNVFFGRTYYEINISW